MRTTIRGRVKRVLLCTLVLGLLLSMIGCVGLMESDYTISVLGSDDLRFSGSYMVTTAGGKAMSRSVDGIVPAHYRVRGVIVSCAFQKQSELGSLRVVISKGGKIVAQSETSAAYGVVSVATP